MDEKLRAYERRIGMEVAPKLLVLIPVGGYEDEGIAALQLTQAEIEEIEAEHAAHRHQYDLAVRRRERNYRKLTLAKRAERWETFNQWRDEWHRSYRVWVKGLLDRTEATPCEYLYLGVEI